MTLPEAVQDLIKRLEAQRDKRQRSRWEELAPEDSAVERFNRTTTDKFGAETEEPDQIEPTKWKISDYILVTDGRILEIGMGSGINIPFYNPDKVEKVWGLEPSLGMREKARARV